MTRIRLALMVYFIMVAPKLHAESCRRPSLSQWKHDGGLAGAGATFHRVFLSWRSVLWCSFLLWSLHVLRQWCSLLAASIYSVWSSARVCLGEDNRSASAFLFWSRQSYSFTCFTYCQEIGLFVAFPVSSSSSHPLIPVPCQKSSDVWHYRDVWLLPVIW